MVERASRFWSLVDRSGGPAACWRWTGNIQDGRFGRFGQELAHRVAYELTYGPVGDRWVLQRCQNPHCVNPAHLYLSTIRDHLADRVQRGGQSIYVAPGEHNGLAKLTEDTVRAIRRDHANGATLRELSARYGTTHQNILHVVRNRTWRHVE